MAKSSLPFAGFHLCTDISKLEADIALIGIPYGTPYHPGSPAPSADAPDAIRRESVRYADDPVAWDFDLDGTLLGSTGARVMDCGDLVGSKTDGAYNGEKAENAIRNILQYGTVPVVLGGDDSIPIPVMRAFSGEKPFHVLQLDAHIDWRDEVKGVRDGYSSTMRRASELPFVESIVQAGMRGVGSAREEEYRAAKDYGAKLVTSYEVADMGKETVLKHLPVGSRCLITLDFDVLDPSIMPAVGAPAPGGMDYRQVIEIIQGAAERCEIVGVCLVELVPGRDVGGLGAVTAMRITWNVIGALARNLR